MPGRMSWAAVQHAAAWNPSGGGLDFADRTGAAVTLGGLLDVQDLRFRVARGRECARR